MGASTRTSFEALASPDHLARLRAADALALALESLPPDDRLTLWAEGLADPRPNVAPELARLAQRLGAREAAPSLRAALERKKASPKLHKAALGALGWVGDQTDAPTLARFVRGGEAMMRRVAVEALGRVGGQGACEALWAGLQDEAWEVRAEAALGLGALPGVCGPGSLKAIERALATEPEPFVRERLLRAIPELGDPARGAALLLGVPLDGDWRALRAAARGLGELRAAQAQAWLRGLLDHPCYDVAEQASWALGRLEP